MGQPLSFTFQQKKATSTASVLSTPYPLTLLSENLPELDWAGNGSGEALPVRLSTVGEMEHYALRYHLGYLFFPASEKLSDTVNVTKMRKT